MAKWLAVDNILRGDNESMPFFLFFCIPPLPESVNFCTTNFAMSKVYTDKVGIKSNTIVCLHVREVIHLQKLVNYLLVQADKPLFNNYKTEII